ncbi:unnamed protein product, partial [Leptidea sinapis]
MSIIGTIHEDVTTDVLGYIGHWQWIVTVLSTGLTITTVFNQYEDMYLLKPPQDIKCISAKQCDVLINTTSTLCTYSAITNASQILRCDQWNVKFMWFFWLMCEISSNVWRTKLNFIVSSPRLLAAVCTIPIVNVVSINLETLNFLGFLLNILILISLRWIPESPVWLLYNRKVPKAEKILMDAAKINQIVLCSDFKIRPVDQRV